MATVLDGLAMGCMVMDFSAMDALAMDKLAMGGNGQLDSNGVPAT